MVRLVINLIGLDIYDMIWIIKNIDLKRVRVESRKENIYISWL